MVSVASTASGLDWVSAAAMASVSDAQLSVKVMVQVSEATKG
jgi:hypothetical protein